MSSDVDEDEDVEEHPDGAYEDEAGLLNRFLDVHFHADGSDEDVNEDGSPAAGAGAFEVAGLSKGKQQAHRGYDADTTKNDVANTFTADQTISAELIADSYNESYNAVTSTSNATTVDCETGNVFSHTLTENTTFTFSNPPVSGTAYAFSLRVVQDASASGYTVTWPGSVDWPSATAPTLTATADAVDWFVFSTVDGGTTWYGFTSGQALA